MNENERQSRNPVTFGQSRRTDSNVRMSSGRAGKVVPLTFVPLLRGDSMSGSVSVDLMLNQMPRPLLNGVNARFQAWFVPKVAHPKFTGMNDFVASYEGETITALGQPDRVPPDFFDVLTGAQVTTAEASELMRSLGLHFGGKPINTDLIDAFVLVYNFRLAAHSDTLGRRQYAAEDLGEATDLPRAFWPTSRFSSVVPDYERALVVGALDLDVSAGQVPVSGIGWGEATGANADPIAIKDGRGQVTNYTRSLNSGSSPDIYVGANNGSLPQVFAEMAGETITTTLADIDKARTTQAFAKLRAVYAGNDTTGFVNDDAIISALMQGFAVPEAEQARPWLLDDKRVTFGLMERHATDAANLDASISEGRASARLSLNVPRADSGGVVIVTVEVLPDRLDERQQDVWMHVTETSDLPNALRDVQRVEPVDHVMVDRLDARHTAPDELYGFEPMNHKWVRASTSLGGVFYQADPANPFQEQRAAIWQSSVVDPRYTDDHWLCPEDFPHDVFSDQNAPAFEAVIRTETAITGLTQIGDALTENQDDYEEVQGLTQSEEV